MELSYKAARCVQLSSSNLSFFTIENADQFFTIAALDSAQ